MVELLWADGRSFPRVNWEGEDMPEAWSYDQRALPHLQAAERKLFPRATAAQEAGDEDLEAAPCSLEQKWQEVCERQLKCQGSGGSEKLESGAGHSPSVNLAEGEPTVVVMSPIQV